MTKERRRESETRVLVVDDEPWIRETIRDYLEDRGYRCRTADDAGEALEHLRRWTFEVMISDLNMPGLSGAELFDRVRREFPDMTVLMLTAVVDVNVAVGLMKQGLDDYLTKPVELEQLGSRVQEAVRQHLERRREADSLLQLQQRLAAADVALESALDSVALQQNLTMETLVRALDARAHETKQHSQRVAAYTLRLAEEFTFTLPQLGDLERGALLHDIGKIGVADAILLKAGELTEQEWAQMRRHPEIGFDILQDIDFLRGAAQLVLHHHERFDGSGYPRGLRGEAIPLEARIFAVIDAFDALTSQRPYREPLPVEVARSRVAARSGSLFDPAVVEKFLRIPMADWLEIRNRFR